MNNAESFSDEPMRSDSRYISWNAWKVEEHNEIIRIQCVMQNMLPYLIALGCISIGTLAAGKYVVAGYRVLLGMGWLFFFVIITLQVIADCMFCKKGDWFVYNKQTDLVTLPRSGIQIERADVAFFQIIVGLPDIAETRYLTQVNVVVSEKNGALLKRYALMRVVGPRLVVPLIEQIAVKLDCEVKEVEYSITGKLMK